MSICEIKCLKKKAVALIVPLSNWVFAEPIESIQPNDISWKNE